jgi:glutathione peroxidase
MAEHRTRRFALAALLSLPAAGAVAGPLRKGGRMQGFDFAFTSIDGEPLPVAEWRGRPLLVANTASFCGYTPQYTDLETVWQRYRDRGLVVLGVPSNDFGEQEPGTAKEIKDFCEGRYQVDFPLAEKQRVVGRDAHPFFRWVAEELGEAGAPRWNFHKYLVGRDGALLGGWPSSVKPTDPAVIREIEAALGAKATG